MIAPPTEEEVEQTLEYSFKPPLHLNDIVRRFDLPTEDDDVKDDDDEEDEENDDDEEEEEEEEAKYEK